MSRKNTDVVRFMEHGLAALLIPNCRVGVVMVGTQNRCKKLRNMLKSTGSINADLHVGDQKILNDRRRTVKACSTVVNILVGRLSSEIADVTKQANVHSVRFGVHLRAVNNRNS